MSARRSAAYVGVESCSINNNNNNMSRSQQHEQPSSPTNNFGAVSSEIESNLLVCPVCFDPLREPRLLPCGHFLCRQCISKIRNSGFGSPTGAGLSLSSVRCVVCRACHPPGVEKELPEQRQSHLLDVPVISQCDRCDKRKAVLACRTCDMVFCTACCELLHQGRMKVRHEVMPLEGTLRTALPSCSVEGHADYHMDLYNMTTGQFMCVKCAQTMSNRSATDSVVPALEAAGEARDAIESWWSVDEARRCAQAAYTGAIDVAVQAVEVAAEEGAKHVLAHSKAVIEQVERQASMAAKRLSAVASEEIQRLCAERGLALAHVSEATLLRAGVQRALMRSDAVELIKNKTLVSSLDSKSPPQVLRFHLPVFSAGSMLPNDLFRAFLSDTECAPTLHEPLTNLLLASGGPSVITSVINFRPLSSSNSAESTPTFVEQQQQQQQQSPVPNDRSENGFCSPQRSSSNAIFSNESNAGIFDCNTKGTNIVLSDNMQVAHTKCSGFIGNAVFGTVPLSTNACLWKLKVLSLDPSRKMYFGIAHHPFNQEMANPYRTVWGWTASGCALPTSDRCCEKAKLRSGNEVWLQFDGNSGKLSCTWPSTGLVDVMELGTQFLTAPPLFAVVGLGAEGNSVELLSGGSEGVWTTPSQILNSPCSSSANFF